MRGSEPVTLILGDTTHELRFTLPALRALSNVTGKGARTLALEVSSLNFESLVLMFWAALNHGANKFTQAQAADIIDQNIGDTDAIIRVLGECVEASWGKPQATPAPLDKQPDPPA